MELLVLSFVAGILTVLAPCILPLLPVIIGGSLADKSIVRPTVITASLAVSVVVFTLLLKATTAFIEIPQIFWTYFSGGIILLFALSLLFPFTWAKLTHGLIPSKFSLKEKGEKLLYTEGKKEGTVPMIIMGAALGPVFASCSPTYFLILGTVLPASFGLGLLYLVVYALGLSLVMFLIAFAGQKMFGKISNISDPRGPVKKVLGIIFLIVGLSIVTGFDKKVEAALLDTGFNISIFEQELLDKAVSGEERDDFLAEHNTEYAKAYFAGGCFWCIEADFAKYRGIKAAESGYMGQSSEQPTYQSHEGFREAVEVVYNSAEITYADLVLYFFQHHDPTDAGGSFADRGFAYTSAIFPQSDEEEQIARSVMQGLTDKKVFPKPIVTAIEREATFWSAEDYHQDYQEKNPLQYSLYRNASGRDSFIKDIWGNSSSTKSWENYERPSDLTLQQILTPEQYAVTQLKATEAPHTERNYDQFYEQGIYVDIVSGEPLFSSKDKYDSGSGWPSFTKPISDNFIVKAIDNSFFQARVEIKSRFSDSHLGHVFDDGPIATGGRRYCVNGASLRFIPLADMEAEGYGEYIDEVK